MKPIQPTFVMRTATRADRAGIIEVEAKTMPNWRYLPQVFEQFVSDESGELLVTEAVSGEDRRLVACGKFTLLPDGSVWLETLRVIPEFQGRGIGKRMYERFFELAKAKGIHTMRMYTGVNNAVSKGLAERFGFRVAQTYRGASLPVQTVAGTDNDAPSFQQVTDPARATTLLMPFAEKWHGFLVMNRTFYAFSPALCAELAKMGIVYEEPNSGSVITAGARFMPEQALHIGVFSAETGAQVAACLGFAMQQAHVQGAAQVSCLFPPAAKDVERSLTQHGFQMSASDFIVMEVSVSG